MTWFLAFNRTNRPLVVDSQGRTADGNEFTYADGTDPAAMRAALNGDLAVVPIFFDPATATAPPVDLEALAAAREVVARNGGVWTPAPQGPWLPDFPELVAAVEFLLGGGGGGGGEAPAAAGLPVFNRDAEYPPSLFPGALQPGDLFVFADVGLDEDNGEPFYAAPSLHMIGSRWDDDGWARWSVIDVTPLIVSELAFDMSSGLYSVDDVVTNAGVQKSAGVVTLSAELAGPAPVEHPDYAEMWLPLENLLDVSPGWPQREPGAAYFSDGVVWPRTGVAILHTTDDPTRPWDLSRPLMDEPPLTVMVSQPELTSNPFEDDGTEGWLLRLHFPTGALAATDLGDEVTVARKAYRVVLSWPYNPVAIDRVLE